MPDPPRPWPVHPGGKARRQNRRRPEGAGPARCPRPGEDEGHDGGVGRIDAGTALRLLRKLERECGGSRTVHVFPDSARHRRAKALRPFPERPQRRVRLRFLPPCAPRLNPTGRLRGAMRRHVTHSRLHADFRQFTEAVFSFFTDTLPREREAVADSVTDSFRAVTHDRCRMAGQGKEALPPLPQGTAAAGEPGPKTGRIQFTEVTAQVPDQF